VAIWASSRGSETLSSAATCVVVSGALIATWANSRSSLSDSTALSALGSEWLAHAGPNSPMASPPRCGSWQFTAYAAWTAGGVVTMTVASVTP